MRTSDFRSFLDDNYSFKGFTVNGFVDGEDAVILELRRIDRICSCPKCGKKCKAEELRKRKVRTMDLVKPCYLEFHQAKIRCSCGYRGNEMLDFVDRHSRYTKRFLEYVSLLSRRMSASDVARLCNLDWKSVKKIEKEYYRSSVQKLNHK